MTLKRGDKAGKITFATRKNKATPNQVKAATNYRVLSSGKPRKNATTVSRDLQKYRPDLAQVSLYLDFTFSMSLDYMLTSILQAAVARVTRL